MTINIFYIKDGWIDQEQGTSLSSCCKQPSLGSWCCDAQKIGKKSLILIYIVLKIEKILVPLPDEPARETMLKKFLPNQIDKFDFQGKAAKLKVFWIKNFF